MLDVPNAKRISENARIERFKRGRIQPGPVRGGFTRFASWSSDRLGSAWAFVIALVLIIVWLVSGPVFQFDQTWMLIINTVTTIGTWLMVFVIQNTQTRESKAVNLKLDELLRAVPKARAEFMEAEEEDIDEILREKEIVARADPAPPQRKAEDRQNGERREDQKAG